MSKSDKVKAYIGSFIIIAATITFMLMGEGNPQTPENFIMSSGNSWEYIATEELDKLQDSNILRVDADSQRLEIGTLYTSLDWQLTEFLCLQMSPVFPYVVVTDRAGTILADNSTGRCVAL